MATLADSDHDAQASGAHAGGVPPATPVAADLVEEVRVAMALNGGVSLAVWMGGSAVELDCARRAHLGREQLEPPDPAGAPPPERRIYHALCEAFRRELVIDLMCGSSAGGINGALLAGAIAGERRLHPDYIREKWMELGDLEGLLHHLHDAAPTSLMDGDSFHRKLRATFHELVPDDADDVPESVDRQLSLPADQRTVLQARGRGLEREVKLDVTVTDVLGAEHRFRDTWDEELVAHEYRQRVAFRRRADYGADRLATAARASASFPLAFEPWPVDGRLLGLDGRRWLIDGGLLDNAPIRSVLELIPSRPSDRQVKRFACYLNADPPQAACAGTSADGRPQLAHVVGYMVNLPRKATFVDHVRAINEATNRARVVEKAQRSLLELDLPALRAAAEALLPAYRARRRMQALEDQLGQPADVARAADRIRDCGGELPWVPRALGPPRGARSWGWGARAAERVVHLVLDLIRHAEREHVAERALLAQARADVYECFVALEGIRDRIQADPPSAALLASLADESAGAAATLCAMRCRMREEDRDPAIREQVRRAAAIAYAIRMLLEPVVREALFGPEPDDQPPAALTADRFCRFLERALCMEVIRRAFASDEELDTDQPLAFAQITPCAPTLLLASRPISGADSAPQRPEEKLTGIRWGHFAGFYRPSWRANDFLWGRLDGAVRIVDMLVDAERARWVRENAGTEPAGVLAAALLPEEGEDSGERRWLVAETLVDAAGVPDDQRFRAQAYRQEQLDALLALEPAALAERLRAAIAEDLEDPPHDGRKPGLVTRTLCARAAQWEVLRHELPIVVAASRSDVGLGTASAPLPPLEADWREVIERLRRAPRPLAESLGRDDAGEQASALMIRTATHGAMVGLSALRATPLPLAKGAGIPRGLLLPIAGLVSRRRLYVGAVAGAYWAFALYVTARLAGVGTEPGSGGGTGRALAVAVTYLALAGVLLVCLVPLWRTVRCRATWARMRQGLWLALLIGTGLALPLGLVVAGGHAPGELAGQRHAPLPWPAMTAAVLATSLGILRFLPGRARKIVAPLLDAEQEAPWRGLRSLVVVLVPWAVLGGWSFAELLGPALHHEAWWRTAAAWVAIAGAPAAALLYVAFSNHGWRRRIQA